MGKCLEICTMAVNDFPSKQQSDRPSVGREEYGFDSTALAPLSQAVHGRKWHEPKTGFSKYDTESANTQLNVTRQRCCSPHLALIKHSQQPYLYCTSFEGYCPSRNLRPKPLPPAQESLNLIADSFTNFSFILLRCLNFPVSPGTGIWIIKSSK